VVTQALASKENTMPLTRLALVYVVTVPVFFAIDLVWLGLIARDFYRRHLGHLLSAQVNWPAAILFYLVFIAGIVFFVVRPALEAGSAARALAWGAFLGFLAYSTYDLTNQATIRDWPLLVTVVDLAWGTCLTALVSFLSYQVSSRVL
jgi:uncharacterized membrane protein